MIGLVKSSSSSAVFSPAASLPLQTVNVCVCVRVDDEGWRSVRGQRSEDNI